MHTQSHMLMGAVLYGRSGPRPIWAGLIGGLLPDVPMILIFATLKVAGFADRDVFRELFFSNWWQIANAIGHSFLLWGALLAASLVVRRRSSTPRLSCLAVTAAAALTHSVVDFLCHRVDAHMHFWPLSRWKFLSPVSYYDPAHYGAYFAVFEALLGIAMAVLLARNIRSLWGRIGLAIIALPYAAVPAYFILWR